MPCVQGLAACVPYIQYDSAEEHNRPEADRMRGTGNWRTQRQRYGLIGEVCPACAKHIFPPRDVCPHCKAQAGPDRKLSGTGKVYSHTTLYSPPAGHEGNAPYTVALVQLDDGPMLTAQLTDVEADKVTMGMRVEMVTRKLRSEGKDGQVIYGYKFRPAWP